MSDYKESKDNPLHREYGIWRNTCYILRKMAEYQPSVLFLALIGLVGASVLTYFWGIFGKYVIDIIQSAEGARRIIWEIRAHWLMMMSWLQGAQ